MAGLTRRAATKFPTTRISGTSCSVNIGQALPEKDAGKDLDWDTVGNITTKYLEDEVAQVAQVDFKYGTEDSREKKNSSKRELQWEYEHCKRDIMVFRKKLYLGSPLTCWAGRGVIDLPLQEVAEFLKLTENNITWDKYLVEASTMKTLSPESSNPLDTIAYMRFEHTSCIVSFIREVLCFARCQYKGGTFIKVGLSIDDPDYPCSQGIKRIDIRLGSGWVLEPYAGNPSKTLVTYVVNSDVKGVPAIVLNQVLKRQSLALHYIKMQLVPTQLASSQDSSGEEENSEQSMIRRKASADVETSFEEGLPTSNFL